MEFVTSSFQDSRQLVRVVYFGEPTIGSVCDINAENYYLKLSFMLRYGPAIMDRGRVKTQ
jgi:hypothetical protein